jgi:hypothetical protein
MLTAFIRVYLRLSAAKPGLMPLLGLLVLTGCKTDPIVPENLNPAPINNLSRADIPDYGDLVRRYNANAASLDRVWARTKVELRWRDERERARRESGDGRLIFERPLQTAWTLEVLGDIKLWAGSDERGFWLFDQVEGSTAFYGSYARPLARRLPLPISPEAVPYLLGFMPLDPDRRPTAPEVELFNGYFVIEPPGLGLRLMLEPATARPVRIDLTDAAGQSQVTCILTGRIDLETADGTLIPLPGTAELYPQGQESRMTVTLRRPTVDDRKFKPQLFNFERLRQSFKPDEVVDLNQP